MRMYYLEDGQGRRIDDSGTTDKEKIEKLVTSIFEGQTPVTNIKVNMDIDEFHIGNGIVTFTQNNEEWNWNINSFKII